MLDFLNILERLTFVLPGITLLIFYGFITTFLFSVVLVCCHCFSVVGFQRLSIVLEYTAIICLVLGSSGPCNLLDVFL